MRLLLISCLLVLLQSLSLNASFTQNDLNQQKKNVIKDSVNVDPLYPIKTISGIYVRFDPWKILDLNHVDEHVTARQTLSKKRPAKSAEEIIRNYVYRITPPLETKDKLAFVPKPFNRQQKLHVPLGNDSAVIWFNRQMELEEQYLYAKRNRISFLNLQFSTFVFGQDLGDQNAYYYGPGLQVFPLGLLLPKLNSLFSSGISYNLPLTGEQTSGINSQNVKLYC
ncbi:MAG: hypothetical protein AAFR87_21585 [Bacteroidota bacterium]